MFIPGIWKNERLTVATMNKLHNRPEKIQLCRKQSGQTGTKHSIMQQSANQSASIMKMQYSIEANQAKQSFMSMSSGCLLNIHSLA
ncbi:hypothetical protein [Desulfobulbus sp.]|uniref:hypothetical protein n=1 Tax=Desulfobulbus sp. TaxID=895 RepID=UPI00286F4A6B|nr:hypothetical protein [Desulfobulbus sp.]